MVTTILHIIELSLAISLEVIRAMPEDQKRAFAERHEQRMQFWQQLFEREQTKEPTT